MTTVSEELFEQFLNESQLGFSRLPERDEPQPDYLVQIEDNQVVFEIKETKYMPTESCGPFRIGAVVREKIKGARRQLNRPEHAHLARVLIIFGTRYESALFKLAPIDFHWGMFVQYELNVIRIRRPGYVEQTSNLTLTDDRTLRSDVNIQFSAVGRLNAYRCPFSITVFGNSYASFPFQEKGLPDSVIFIRNYFGYVTTS